MSDVKNTLAAWKETNTQINGTTATITMTPEDSDAFTKCEAAYIEAAKGRDEFTKGALNLLATRSKSIFEEEDEVTMVETAFNFADMTIGGSIHRNYTLDNGDVVENYTLLQMDQDFSVLVSEALDGVFTEALEADSAE